MIDHNYDLIVIGAGAAGLAAASAGAALGARVLLVESTARVGGSTAISGGMVWIPANHKMRQAGIDDSAEASRRYVEETVPGVAHDTRMRAFLDLGDAAIRYLEAHTSLKLQPVKRYPDYYPDLPGATAGGRVLEPVTFDARELGRDFALLRDPLPEFMISMTRSPDSSCLLCRLRSPARRGSRRARHSKRQRRKVISRKYRMNRTNGGWSLLMNVRQHGSSSFISNPAPTLENCPRRTRRQRSIRGLIRKTESCRDARLSL
ncbi:FAD-dependent oxidoreductase [Caballeronia grimmiae]|uniref:FAD-dependent oxidoreductase n=1 Tax=Caballeronia grimmiae TaxID=1071679 RepID=UPI0038BBDC8B